MKDFSNEIRGAIEDGSVGSSVDTIEARRCSSDDHDGIEYSIEGTWVLIEPILDVFAKEDEYAIEQLGFTTDEGGSLTVFVADLSTEAEKHPAFV